MTQITELPAGSAGLASKVIETQVDSLGGLSEKFTAQDIVDLVPLGAYLPLAGGKMTGQLIIDDQTEIIMHNEANNEAGRIWWGDTFGLNAFNFTNNNGLAGFNVFDTGYMSIGNAVGQQIRLAATGAGGGAEVVVFATNDIDLESVQGVINVKSNAVVDDGHEIQFVDQTDQQRGRIWYGDIGVGAGNSFNFTDPTGSAGYNVFDDGQVAVGSVLGNVSISATGSGDTVDILGNGGISLLATNGNIQIEDTRMNFRDGTNTVRGFIEYTDDNQFAFLDPTGDNGFSIALNGNVGIGGLTGEVLTVGTRLAFTTVFNGDIDITTGTGVVNVNTLLKSVTNPVDDQDAATKGYVDANAGIRAVEEDLSPTLGGDLQLNGKSIYEDATAAAGNNFNIGEIGYKNAAGEVVTAQANAEATSEGSLVMALDQITAGTSGRFAIYGQVKGLTGGTAGAKAYLSISVPGGTQTTVPSGAGNFARLVGYWLDAGTFNFLPSTDYIELQ